jgi:hypothetical protein
MRGSVTDPRKYTPIEARMASKNDMNYSEYRRMKNSEISSNNNSRNLTNGAGSNWRGKYSHLFNPNQIDHNHSQALSHSHPYSHHPFDTTLHSHPGLHNATLHRSRDPSLDRSSPPENPFHPFHPPHPSDPSYPPPSNTPPNPITSIHKKIILQLAENALIQNGLNPSLNNIEATLSDTSNLQSPTPTPTTPYTQPPYSHPPIDTQPKNSHQEIVNKYLETKPKHSNNGSLPGEGKSYIDLQFTENRGRPLGDTMKTLSELRENIRQDSGGKGRGAGGWVEGNRDFEMGVEKRLRSPVRGGKGFDKDGVAEYLRREMGI